MSWHKDSPYEEGRRSASTSGGSSNNGSVDVLPPRKKYPSRRSIRHDAPCQIIPIKGRGLGIVATRPLEEGELILQERALFKLWQSQPSASDIKAQLSRLSKVDKDTFYDLANSESEDVPIEQGIWATNVFQIDNTYKGIFPIASRINSSCRPNIAYSEDLRAGALQFRTIRPVKRGEELCHAYEPELHVRSERQRRYKSNWDFDCACELCTASQEDVDESDDRICRMNKLEQRIKRENRSPILRDAEYYEMVWRMLQMLKTEGRPHLRYDFTSVAYKRAVAGGDAEQCRNWAKRTYKYAKLRFGRKDPRALEWAGLTQTWEKKLLRQSAEL